MRVAPAAEVRAGLQSAIQQVFLRACSLDVAVRKPGNVSWASAGHGMAAQQFITSAQVAAPALCRWGASVGERIETAVRATRQAVGCNTNLGILLLCAPLAHAAERWLVPASAPGPADAASSSPADRAAGLRAALEASLAELGLDDAAATFRAIAWAQPGGLGQAEQQDVHQAPTLALRQAMALAAERDRIARQYRDGFAELFDLALPVLGPGFSGSAPDVGEAAAPAVVAAVQRLYLAWLASAPDSHIVRKHGQAVAQTVMAAAQAWQTRSALPSSPIDADPAFARWDESLKSSGINPGTSADLVVAGLMLSGLLGIGTHRTPGHWHGS